MTMKATTGLDLDTYKRAFEAWDIETLLGLYADDVELIEINRENPPHSPRVRRGKDMIRGILEGAASAGVKGTAENPVDGEDRAAVTFTCEFPDGRRVMANAILEVEDGRIVRHLEVQAGDPQ
jgi:ketosteroid isomerase-like protein